MLAKLIGKEYGGISHVDRGEETTYFRSNVAVTTILETSSALNEQLCTARVAFPLTALSRPLDHVYLTIFSN